MARGTLSPGFLLPQILTLPLFILLGCIGLTPALCCHNLKSHEQQQLFPGSLSGPKQRLESSSASPSLFPALSLLPFLWQLHHGPLPIAGPPHLTLVFNFGEFSPSSRFLSSPTVDFLLWTTEALADQETSIHQLDGLNCHFLGMLRKYTGTLPQRHIIDSQELVKMFLTSDISFLSGRTTVGKTYHLFPQKWARNPWGTVCWDVSSKTYRLWVSQKS
jgi:hypothetical protein